MVISSDKFIRNLSMSVKKCNRNVVGQVNHPQGVTKGFINSGSYTIDIADEKIPAWASLKAFYAPPKFEGANLMSWVAEL